MSVIKKVFVFLLCLSFSFLKANAQTYHTTAVVPKIFAVVIGISKYKYPALGLDYADKDAQAFYNFLRSPNCGNTPENQIKLLKNEEATRQNVLEAVDALASRASANDVLIIYYAGHGTNATSGNFFYLETYDTDPMQGRIRASATSAGDIKEYLDNSQAKMVIWITDACNSGRLQINEQGRGRGGSANLPSGAAKFLDEVAKQDKGGFLYMAACESQEKSIEDSSKRHGIFTYHLIEALKGVADADHNCIVTIKECFDYVRDKVIADTKDAQHPVIGKYDYNSTFPISTTGNCVGKINLNSQRQMFIAKRDTSSSKTRPLLSRDMDINSYTSTGIKVARGETVWITATGSIHVGPFVGESGPDGRQTGLLGFTLQQYNIVRNFNHAVLMYKLGANDEWISCGANYHFTATRDGELIFQVNDNDQGNNSGAYHVTIKKFN